MLKAARTSMTLGAWARREAVLLALLGIGAALGALGKLLGSRGLMIVGVTVALIGAIVRTGIAIRRAQLESERERVVLDRRLRVPIETVSQIDPTNIGVDPAAQTVLAGAELPEYVPRQADDELRAAINDALEREGRWLVILHGPSKVGKSRTLFEALASCAPDADLVAPIDGDALRSLLTPGETPSLNASNAVLWLDDLEPFLNDGVKWQTLTEWHERFSPGAIVVATYGGKGSELVAETSKSALGTIAGEMLQHASEIGLAASTSVETDPLRTSLPVGVLDSIHQHGLAAYLVAAPALERKLSTRRQAPGQPECPEGVAVVHAAVDWARCGRTDPITEDTLRELWSEYLPAGAAATDEAFARGLDWALLPVAGTIALLQSVGSFSAYDYIVRFVSQPVDAPAPLDAAWNSAVKGATDAQALAVASSAYANGSYDPAISALTCAIESSIDEVAAIAWFNLGITLGALRRSDDEIAAYDEVVVRFGDASEPALREQVAKALFNKGATLGDLERPEEAIAAYDNVVGRLGDATEPALREQVAKALIYKGITLGGLERPEEAIAAYDNVVSRLGDATETALREQVAKALVNKGVSLRDLERSEEAIAAYDDVAARFGDATDPALLEQVATALIYKGVTLGGLERPEDEIAAYDEVIARLDDATEAALREQVAKALVNQ
jgi:tetratricopeptide (TPR) repeat protein